MNLGEHFAKGYMIEPLGIHPQEITYRPDGAVVIKFGPFTGQADRLVFARNGIMVAWLFGLVWVGGGDLTLEIDIL